MTPPNWLKPTPAPLACYDCGLRYGGPGWMDAVVPHDLWEKISPTGDEGGILCITCMARRCEALGLNAVPIEITSGPFCGHSLDGYFSQQNAAYRFAVKKIAALVREVLAEVPTHEPLEGAGDAAASLTPPAAHPGHKEKG